MVVEMYNFQLREKIPTTTQSPSPGDVLIGQYPRRTLQIPNCSVSPLRILSKHIVENIHFVLD